jgi:hypothetical protein
MFQERRWRDRRSLPLSLDPSPRRTGRWEERRALVNRSFTGRKLTQRRKGAKAGRRLTDTNYTNLHEWLRYPVRVASAVGFPGRTSREDISKILRGRLGNPFDSRSSRGNEAQISAELGAHDADQSLVTSAAHSPPAQFRARREALQSSPSLFRERPHGAIRREPQPGRECARRGNEQLGAIN